MAHTMDLRTINAKNVKAEYDRLTNPVAKGGLDLEWVSVVVKVGSNSEETFTHYKKRMGATLFGECLLYLANLDDKYKVYLREKVNDTAKTKFWSRRRKKRRNMRIKLRRKRVYNTSPLKGKVEIIRIYSSILTLAVI